MAGKKADINADVHNFGAAVGWGGFTKKRAVYIFFQEVSADLKTLTHKNVPMADHAFWSITVYGSDGYPRGALILTAPLLNKDRKVTRLCVSVGRRSKTII